MVKTNRQSRKTKAKIKNALMELMAEQELSKITINELTEKADISRRTFYLHYTDFKALLREIEVDNMELVKNRVLDNLLEDGELKLYDFFESLNDVIVKENQYYTSASKSAYSLYIFSKIEELMVNEILEKGNNISKPAGKMDVLKVTFFVTGAVKVFCQWINDGRPVTLKTLIESIEECFGNGYNCI